MKKFTTILLAAVLALGALTGCGAAKEDDKVITIGASVTPHAEILKVAAEELEKEGYTLEIREFTDYVLPNEAVENDELFANYFQHEPYMTNFNEEKGTHLASVLPIHYEPFGVYCGKSKDIHNVRDGAVIAVPNDGSNEARALFLLERLGLIELKENTPITSATVLDIVSNPKNLDIQEMEAAQLARVLPDVDFAVINGNYAIQAGLNARKDAVATEDKNSEAAVTYANILCVKQGNEESEKTKALVKALTSDAVKAYIEETYEGAVLPVF